jgi:hypothetical protein
MARFFFHVRTGGELAHDPEGSDLADLAEARREALLAARELLADAIKAGRERVPDAFVIADEAGRAVETVPLAAVLPKPLRRKSSPELMLAQRLNEN